MTPSHIADPGLAPEGHRRIEWARQHMPVLHRLLAERLSDGALAGRKVAVVVHLEAKTACLVLALQEAGAQVVAAGSNPLSTQDAVCAALVERGVEVHARHGVSQAEFTADLLAVAETGPELVIDDGLELTRRIAEHRPDLYELLQGVSEETTTGVARLRALEAEGRLPFPAIAANDAKCKHMFDNTYGTGQTTLTALLALTNVLAAGREFCIVGYGWVGKGLARAADGLGGRVTVVELDPVRALTAHMDGYRVASLANALPDADVVLTATGLIEAIGADAFPCLKDGALLANAGHHDREIDVPALAAAADEVIDARPHVKTYLLGERRVHVLVDGALVNIAGLDGNPIEIMDLSFSVQALSTQLLASGGVPAGLNRFPGELDDLIARTKLATLGIELNEPTEAQLKFRASWAV
ncbi:MAG TPA: adenosylhomocysteinase [Gaiellaceae bacterium]|jgi:adenosylhomocysteinase|nr:adenosylhomocysteinase [Gaiellaceae bacterium]